MGPGGRHEWVTSRGADNADGPRFSALCGRALRAGGRRCAPRPRRLRRAVAPARRTPVRLRDRACPSRATGRGTHRRPPIHHCKCVRPLGAGTSPHFSPGAAMMRALAGAFEDFGPVRTRFLERALATESIGASPTATRWTTVEVARAPTRFSARTGPKDRRGSPARSAGGRGQRSLSNGDLRDSDTIN